MMCEVCEVKRAFVQDFLRERFIAEFRKNGLFASHASQSYFVMSADPNPKLRICIGSENGDR